MRCRDFRILRGNLQTASGLRSGFVIKPFTHSNHHAALGNLQIQRPVKPRAAVFDQHVFARNAEVRRAVADISRHIGCADNDKADVFMVRPDNQLARFFGLFSRSNAGSGKQRQRLLKMRPLDKAMVKALSCMVWMSFVG